MYVCVCVLEKLCNSNRYITCCGGVVGWNGMEWNGMHLPTTSVQRKQYGRASARFHPEMAGWLCNGYNGTFPQGQTIPSSNRNRVIDPCGNTRVDEDNVDDNNCISTTLFHNDIPLFSKLDLQFG